MDFDFELLFVGVTLVTGVIAGIDKLFFASKRCARLERMIQLGSGSEEERQARLKEMIRTGSGTQEERAYLEEMVRSGSCTEEEKRKRAEKLVKEPYLAETARSFFPIIFAITAFRSFIVEPFKIPSSSMMPTLLVGDFILVNKFSYGLRIPVLRTKILDTSAPKRGDVIVFRYPENPKINYIKRVVGLPGDEITYRDKVIYVNGKEVPQIDIGTYVGQGTEGSKASGSNLKQESLGDIDHRILLMPRFNLGREGVYDVPEGQYFVMGDNRDNSQDSRFWGFVPEQNLVGKAFAIWMNWDSGIDFKRIGTLIK